MAYWALPLTNTQGPDKMNQLNWKGGINLKDGKTQILIVGINLYEFKPPYQRIECLYFRIEMQHFTIYG